MKSLVSLKRGIEGLELISEELELVMYSIDENKVPAMWGFCYHSIKPLMSWLHDFSRRMEQFERWQSKNSPPTVHWIAGYCYPNGFITAML